MNTPAATPAPTSTPRTDAAEKELNSWTHSVSSDFARQLERELSDCRRTCAELVTDGNAVTLAESLQRKCAELSAANERNKQLTQQLNALRLVCGTTNANNT